MSKALEPIDLTRLQPDVRAVVEAEIAARLKAEKVARVLKDIIKRFEHLVKELRHALYGKKSEKLPPDDRQLCFEDLEVAVSEAEEHQAHLKDDAPRKKATKSKRNLGNLPKELPRIENIIEPDSILCPCGCGEMVRIGEDCTERLDIIPAQLRVIVTIRPKYAWVEPSRCGPCWPDGSPDAQRLGASVQSARPGRADRQEIHRPEPQTDQRATGQAQGNRGGRA